MWIWGSRPDSAARWTVVGASGGRISGKKNAGGGRIVAGGLFRGTVGRKILLCRSLGLEYLERHRCEGSFDPGYAQKFIIDEFAHIVIVGDIELHQQVILARGRIELGMDFAQGDILGHFVGRARFAADLDKDAGGHRPLVDGCGGQALMPVRVMQSPPGSRGHIRFAIWAAGLSSAPRGAYKRPDP